jgi:exodeoxyribonuclease VII small subunit
MAKAKTTRTYRDMSDELADIIAWFESEDIDLDEATAKYEQATKLLGQMESYLKNAENKIHEVSVSSKK